MEQNTVGVSPPERELATAPKTYKLATWAMVLGIIGLPLFFLMIPSLLAIIFGIIGLVKISNSAGLLKGKGRALAGLILGAAMPIMIPILAIVAAIVIPNLMTSSLASNEIRAIANLRVLVSCEGLWNYRDGKYWTYDVSALHRLKSKSTYVTAELAGADGAPADDNIFGAGQLSAGAKAAPLHGYLFQAMQEDENGQAYNQGEFNGVKATNKSRFAFVAYPAEYGKTGIRTFIVNEKGQVYSADPGNGDKKAVLKWPGADPTKVVSPDGIHNWALTEISRPGGG